MARTSRPAASRVDPVDHVAAVRSLAPVIVTATASDGGVGLRAMIDAVNDLPTVVEARACAFGSRVHRATLTTAVASLYRRSAAASEDALNPIPF